MAIYKKARANVSNNKRSYLSRLSILGNSLSTFDTNAAAYFTAAGITNSAEKTAVNTFIVGLKADNLWTKMIRLWLISPTSLAAAKVCAKTLEVLITGGYNNPTHSSTGLTFNGFNQALVTPTNINSASWAGFSSGIISFGYYLNAFNDSSASNGLYCGTTLNADAGSPPKFSGDWAAAIGNAPGLDDNLFLKGYLETGAEGSAYDSGTIFNPGGLLIGRSRVDDTADSLSWNGSTVYTDVLGRGDPSLWSFRWMLGAANGIFYDTESMTDVGSLYHGKGHKMCFAFTGTLIDDDADILKLYNRVQTLQTTLGRQV